MCLGHCYTPSTQPKHTAVHRSWVRADSAPTTDSKGQEEVTSHCMTKKGSCLRSEKVQFLAEQRRSLQQGG